MGLTKWRSRIISLRDMRSVQAIMSAWFRLVKFRVYYLLRDVCDVSRQAENAQ
jgi:hypothetical protein